MTGIGILRWRVTTLGQAPSIDITAFRRIAKRGITSRRSTGSSRTRKRTPPTSQGLHYHLEQQVCRRSDGARGWNGEKPRPDDLARDTPTNRRDSPRCTDTDD